MLLEVVKKDGKGTGLLTEIGNDCAGSAYSLLDTTIIIELSESAPCPKFLSKIDHDNMDFSLGTKSADKLLVFLVFTVLGETAEASGATVKSLGAFMEPLFETVMNESLLEYL